MSKTKTQWSLRNLEKAFLDGELVFCFKATKDFDFSSGSKMSALYSMLVGLFLVSSSHLESLGFP